MAYDGGSSVRRRRRGGGFSPSTLFKAGEQGVIYDIQDISSMSQDTAGNTPAVVDQLVKRIADKSGRGNHATHTNGLMLKLDASGKYYLDYDGSAGGFSTSAFNAGSDKVQTFAGVQKRSDAAVGMIAEFSANSNSNAGSWQLRGPGAANFAGYFFNSSGSVLAAATAQVISGLPPPNDAVLTAISDISAKISRLYVNGTQAGQSTGDQGTGNYGNYPLYLGRRGGSSLPAIMRLYGYVLRFGPNLDAATLAAMNSWMAAKTPLGRFGDTDTFSTDFSTYANGAIPAMSNNGRLFRVTGAINTSTVVPTISGGACIASDSGQAQTASYFGYDAGVAIREMYAQVSFGAQATGGGFGLICNPYDVGGSSTVQAITDKSVHIIFTDTQVNVGYYSGGDRFGGGSTPGTLTNTAVVYSGACARDGVTKYTVGWRIISSDTIQILLPTGETATIVDSQLVAKIGQYGIFEHYWQTGKSQVAFHKLAANSSPSWIPW